MLNACHPIRSGIPVDSAELSQNLIQVDTGSVLTDGARRFPGPQKQPPSPRTTFCKRRPFL